MATRKECLISDLSVAQPATAVSSEPKADCWLVVPYEGEVSGKLLWAPVRNHPPEISVPLPDLGLCKIYIGIYGSGTVPIWYGLVGATQQGAKRAIRVELRLSGDDWIDVMTPTDYPEQPRFTYTSESLWRTADVSGQSLVFSRTRKEAYDDATSLIAYIRLVPVERAEVWPAATKRLAGYMDSNFSGHYVDSERDIRSHFAPLVESDTDMVFWTTSREDSCYYPTRVGNPVPADTVHGLYPYWAGRDMKRMLDRGEDPLEIVCRVAREYGLEIFGSYRRMTRRMPPFVFPIHADSIFEKRADLRCVKEDGEVIPHLSLAFPEVRQRMVLLQAEQAANYDLDGIHMFFCRGMPFVYFEKPVIEQFEREYGEDPRRLPIDDERVWVVRGHFFVQYLRDLRTALDRVGERKGKRLKVAMHVMNNLRTCAYYGMDMATMIEERLIDVVIPSQGHFFPAELGERFCTPDMLAEFVALARGTGVQVRPALEQRYWGDRMPFLERVAAYYAAGADGLLANAGGLAERGRLVVSKLGHVDELLDLERRAEPEDRMVRVDTLAGLSFNMNWGIPTCG